MKQSPVKEHAGEEAVGLPHGVLEEQGGDEAQGLYHGLGAHGELKEEGQGVGQDQAPYGQGGAAGAV